MSPSPPPRVKYAKYQIPNAVLDLLRTAYPTAQGVVQNLVDAVYNALTFVPSLSDRAFWSDSKYDNRRPSSEEAAEKVAEAIRSAAKAATGGNDAPALLSYLDAEDAGAFVINIMAAREAKNKKAELGAMKIASGPDTSDKDLDKMWAKLRPSVRLGKFDISDYKESDLEYFNSLAPWEQRWVNTYNFVQNGFAHVG